MEATVILFENLKGLRHIAVNKPVMYLLSIIFAHVYPLRSAQILVDGVNESRIKLLMKIHQHLCNRTTYK